MNIRDLLNRDISCSCGRTHRCDIATVEIGKGALECLPHATEQYGNILLVADGNTAPLCADRVKALLGTKLEGFCLFSQCGISIPQVLLG